MASNDVALQSRGRLYPLRNSPSQRLFGRTKARAQFQMGFTLIELLVVISVIGLLASVIMVALNSARVKARDIKRMSDIGQLQTALELYYDKYSIYPNISQSADSTNCEDRTPALVFYLGEFMSSIPHDPQGPPAVPNVDAGPDRHCYFYNVKKSGQGYVIMAYQVEQVTTAAKGEGAACYPDVVNVYCKGINYQ